MRKVFAVAAVSIVVVSILFFNLSSLRNPENSSVPINMDSDGDGLLDSEEQVLSTNPHLADTDGDGLSDGAEVNTHGTNPLVADTDNDGLKDGDEITLGLLPLNYDTDNDGLPDDWELQQSSNWEFQKTLNPKRRNVLVEIDIVEGARIPTWYEISALENEFAKAPISNPDGSTGVDILLYFSDFNLPARENDENSIIVYENYRSLYENKAEGWIYALLHPGMGSFSSGKVIYIFANAGYQVGLPLVPDGSVATTFLHELGHSLGLMPSVFEGIDSTKYSIAEYPSVMNYSSDYTEWPLQWEHGYSTSGVFNDWGYLGQGFAKNTNYLGWIIDNNKIIGEW